MRTSVFAVVAALFVAAAPASAALHSVSATLSVAIGTFAPAGFAGAAAAASSAGAGGPATLPASAISGVFSTAISPPLLTILDGIGVGAPGTWPASPASNFPLGFDGTTGTMSLNAAAYLLMGGIAAAQIPLGVIGVGGTQMFHVGTLISGLITANPYQLGMLTLMGALNTAPHTLVATGLDARSAGGQGTLVLVSPTTVEMGALGSLASVSVLSLNFGPAIPEPGTLLLLGAGVSALALGRRRPS
jgi:hypothetical protein